MSEMKKSILGILVIFTLLITFLCVSLHHVDFKKDFHLDGDTISLGNYTVVDSLESTIEIDSTIVNDSTNLN